MEGRSPTRAWLDQTKAVICVIGGGHSLKVSTRSSTLTLTTSNRSDWDCVRMRNA